MRKPDVKLQNVLQHIANELQDELPSPVIGTNKPDKFSNERLGSYIEQIVNSFKNRLWTEETRKQLQLNIYDFLNTAIECQNIDTFNVGVDITNKERESILEENKIWIANDKRIKHVLSFKPNPNEPWHFLVIYDNR